MLYKTKLRTSVIILPGKIQSREGRKDFQFAHFMEKQNKGKKPIQCASLLYIWISSFSNTYNDFHNMP